MKKRMIILLQIIIAVVLIGTSVYASVSATLDLNVSSNTLKKGDEVTVTLSLKDDCLIPAYYCLEGRHVPLAAVPADFPGVT